MQGIQDAEERTLGSLGSQIKTSNETKDRWGKKGDQGAAPLPIDPLEVT